jgi:hypothetical protein
MMCIHTTICVSSYYYIRVLILLKARICLSLPVSLPALYMHTLYTYIRSFCLTCVIQPYSSTKAHRSRDLYLQRSWYLKLLHRLTVRTFYLFLFPPPSRGCRFVSLCCFAGEQREVPKHDTRTVSGGKEVSALDTAISGLSLVECLFFILRKENQ